MWLEIVKHHDTGLQQGCYALGEEKIPNYSGNIDVNVVIAEYADKPL